MTRKIFNLLGAMIAGRATPKMIRIAV